jgi:hypothetical protein
LKSIVSASRRTDIPAFYSTWFMNRVRAGFCLVANPFRPSQVRRVSLRPEDVEAIVFWSKNPEPMIAHLGELESRGFGFIFQFTLNGYPVSLEPKVGPMEKRLETFRTLSRRLGSGRVVWRYDPIILSDGIDPAYHRDRFARLAASLEGFTDRVSVSVVDPYRKTIHNMSRPENPELRLHWAEMEGEEMDRLLGRLAAIAREHRIRTFSCAEPRDLSHLGIQPGRCVDGELLASLFGIEATVTKDPGQREHCGCAVSRDIGATDTCAHGCPYCYATRRASVAEERMRSHDPDAPALAGPGGRPVSDGAPPRDRR